MTIRQSYDAVLVAHTLLPDEAQQRVVDRLDQLQCEILTQSSSFSRMRRWLPGVSDRAVPQGITFGVVSVVEKHS